jgi:hypothetical protein
MTILKQALGSHRHVVGGLAPASLLDSGGAYAVAQGKCPYACFTELCWKLGDGVIRRRCVLAC